MLYSKSLFIYLTCSMIQVGTGDLLGPGIWSLISLSECPDKIPDELVTIETNKHKINRTHDGVSAKIVSRETIDDSYGVYVDVCKYVDGGCKQYQVFTDDSMVRLIDKYAKDSVLQALIMANIDPPEFPVKEGKYELEDYIMDYCTLPREAIYGKFESLAYLVKDGKKVACIKCIAEFTKFEDENYCGDD